MHNAALVHYHIEIGYGRCYGDGTHISGGIDCPIVNFEDRSLERANCVPALLRVSFFLISVTKL